MTLTAYDLRTEHRTTPLGIDVHRPRLAWRLRSDERRQEQTGYRITVFAEAFLPGTPESSIWNSGWVESSEPLGVAVEASLSSATRSRWNLELKDVHGVEFTAGESWFETGLLSADEFLGQWIGRNPRFDREFDPPQDDQFSAKVRNIPPASYLRRGFKTTARDIARARVYATAHGIYELRLNGSRVGDHELAPGWTDYNDRVMYQSFDVTDLVHTGENALGITLADGWWSGYVGFDSRRQGNHYGTFPEAWAQLVIDYSDGSRQVVTTDDTWLESRGAIFYTDMLMGEYVDARADLGDWSSPDYDDSAWGTVTARQGGLETLVAMVDEPIRAMEVVPAISVTSDGAGTWLYDFGQNLVGRVRAAVGPLAENQRVQFRHGETLDDGHLYVANLRTAEATDVYLAAGAKENLFEPTFTVHGFRYLEISGLTKAPAPADVVAVVLRNDTPWSGEIETSNNDVNQLLRNIKWGQRGNFVGVPTDCPQRDERLGWMADAQVFLPTAALNADVASFFTRWLRDVRYAQTDEGSFPDVAPVVSQFFADGAPAWADGGVIMPWHLYRTYGDLRLLADSFDSMRRWVDFIEINNSSLIWTKRVGNHYGDWLQIDAVTPRPVLATAYFAQSAALVSKAAAALGDRVAEERYAGLAQRVRDAFGAAFVAEDHRIEGDTQTVYLLALQFELLPASARDDLAGHLVRTIEQHDGLLTTGFVGVSLICPALTAIGRSDLAYALLETDRYPSWLYSVRQGATTIWERWDGWTEHAGFQSVEMNSFNHYSLGSVGEWIYQDVAGINQTPESVAYESLRIAPQVGGSLNRVTASYESARGRISTAWSCSGEQFRLQVEVPPGARAIVVVPSRDGVVCEGASPVESLAGGSGLLRSADAVSVTVPSGHYDFTSRV